jgi:serine/threonine protein kinase
MNEFDITCGRIAAANTPEDVFGMLAMGQDRVQALGRLYRQLVHVVHPDHNPHFLKVATVAFQRLTQLRGQAEERLKAGLYGTAIPTPAPPPKDAAGHIVVAVRGHRYVLARKVARGDVCDVYRGGEDGADDLVFKVAQHPADNDLLENEATLLKTFAAGSALDRYTCSLRDSFLLKSKTQSRRVNVLGLAAGHRSLAEVARVYPKGLDYRDVAWMFKRTLAALWYLHGAGYVHGAILPEHVLIDPVTHGAKLVDFCYATKIGGIVKAISGPHRKQYAPEILAKQPVTPATDISMTATLFLQLMASGSGAQAKVAGFFTLCNLINPRGRPNDAGDLHDEFDALLRKLAGPPRYRPFPMPPEGAS